MKPYPDDRITGLKQLAKKSSQGAVGSPISQNKGDQPRRMQRKERFESMALKIATREFIGRLNKQHEQRPSELAPVREYYPRQSHLWDYGRGPQLPPDDRDDRLRQLATECFKQTAPELWRYIFDHLDTDQWDIGPIHRRISEVISKESSDSTVRRSVARFLFSAPVPTPDYLQSELLDVVSDEDKELLYCFDSCTDSRAKEWKTFLLGAMKHTRPQVRFYGILLLDPSDAAEGVPHLIRALQDENGEVREMALGRLDLLREHAKSAIPSIVKLALATDDESVRHTYLVSILHIDPSLALPLDCLASVFEPASRQAVMLTLLDMEIRLVTACPENTFSKLVQQFRQELQQRWGCGPSRFPDRVPETQQHLDGPDDRTRTWWWKGRSVRLSNYPFRLLSYLWGKEVVAVEDVEAQVWGHGTDVKQANLKTQLHRANKALEETRTDHRYRLQGAQIIRDFSKTPK